MKVLIVVAQLGLGGQERQLTYLLAAIDVRLVQASIFVWNLNEDEPFFRLVKEMGFTIVGANPKMSSLDKFRKLRKYVFSNQISIVQSYSFYLNFVIWASTVGVKSRSIGALRSMLSAGISTQGRLLGGLNALLPRTMVANSFSGAAEVIATYTLFKKGYVYIIPNRLDISYFEPRQREMKLPFVTVSTGSVIAVKRIDILVKAINKVKEMGMDIRHYHAGVGSEWENIKRIIKDCNLEDNFFLVGELTDVRKHLLRADVFVHTSEVEGTPNAIMEAMASGVPIVSTDCGDTKYLLKDGINGFVVPVGNVAMLADRILFLLKDRELRARIGAEARKYAEENFSLEKLFEENYSLYVKMSPTL